MRSFGAAGDSGAVVGGGRLGGSGYHFDRGADAFESGGCTGHDAFWEPSTAAVRAVGFGWDRDGTWGSGVAECPHRGDDGVEGPPTTCLNAVHVVSAWVEVLVPHRCLLQSRLVLVIDTGRRLR